MPYANPEAAKAAQRKRYEANRERLIEEAKERHRRRVDSGEYQAWLDRTREQRAEYKRRKRAEAGATPREIIALQAAIKRAGQSPSVARLVMDEQRRRWREHPEERRAYIRRWSAQLWAWRYQCDPMFRRHECQRNSEKKARNRGNHTVRLSRNAVAARFAEMGNCCAFCGSKDNLVVEHFIPRAKGGPHAIGNILPACHTCNTSKRDHDPQAWYRQQPFFSQRRWRLILRTLGKAGHDPAQLPLL